MNSYSEKKDESKNRAAANNLDRKKSNKSTFQFIDNRPEAIAQKKMQEMANNRPQTIHPLQNQLNNTVIQRSFAPSTNLSALENVRKKANNPIFNNLFDELREYREKIDFRITRSSRMFLFNELAVCLKQKDYDCMIQDDFQSDDGKEAIAGACHEMKHAMDILSKAVGNPGLVTGMEKLDRIITTELNAWLSEAKSYVFSRGTDPIVSGWREFSPDTWNDSNAICSRLKNYTIMFYEENNLTPQQCEQNWIAKRDQFYGPSGRFTPKIEMRKANFEDFIESMRQRRRQL